MLLVFTIKKNTGNENTSIPAILLKPAQQQYKYNRENPWFDKTCSFELSTAPDGLGISYEISLYYHIGMLKNWREIVLDQLDTLERCGLGYMASDMTISYSNPFPNTTEEEAIEEIEQLLNRYNFASRLSSNVTFMNAGQVIPYERPIMEHMSTSCRRFINNHKNMTRIVFYFHNKGCSRYSEDNETDASYRYQTIFYWRKFLEYFLLERPALCTRAILNYGTMTCGANAVTLVEQKWNLKHYSGNFWSASCNYIADLPVKDAWPIRYSPPYFKYIAAELWIGNYTGGSFANATTDLWTGNPYNRSKQDDLKFLSFFNYENDGNTLYKKRAMPEDYARIL